MEDSWRPLNTCFMEPGNFEDSLGFYTNHLGWDVRAS
jgi:hypothetical protein